MRLQLFQYTTLVLLVFGLFAVLPRVGMAAEPAVPENLSVQTTGTRTAVVSWDPVAGAESYTLEVFTRAGAQTGIFTNLTATSKRVGKKALRKNKAYYVRVKAVNVFGTGGFTERVDFRMPPAKVRGLQVVAQTKHTTTFEWKKPRGDISYYLIQVKRKGKVRRVIKKIGGLDNPDPRFTLKNLKRSRAYGVRVRAVGEDNSKGPYADRVLLRKGRSPV